MNEFYDETTTPEIEPDFEPAYNLHYITINAQGRITDGWSDGPNPDRDTAGAICINEQGGYQFRLIYNAGFVGPDAEFPTIYKSEENPPLYTTDGIPLYKWNGLQVVPRTEEEIAADRTEIPEPPPSQLDRLEAQSTYTAMMTGTLLGV